MVACASQDSTAPRGYDEARAKKLFSEGDQDVSDIYIEEVAVSDLAVAGLSSLASIDPAIGIRSGGDRLSVSIDGRLMASYPEPDTMAAQGWGALTASVISAARYHSAQLATADSARLSETVFDGLLSQHQLGRASRRERECQKAYLSVVAAPLN